MCAAHPWMVRTARGAMDGCNSSIQAFGAWIGQYAKLGTSSKVAKFSTNRTTIVRYGSKKLRRRRKEVEGTCHLTVVYLHHPWQLYHYKSKSEFSRSTYDKCFLLFHLSYSAFILDLGLKACDHGTIEGTLVPVIRSHWSCVFNSSTRIQNLQ